MHRTLLQRRTYERFNQKCPNTSSFLFAPCHGLSREPLLACGHQFRRIFQMRPSSFWQVRTHLAHLSTTRSRLSGFTAAVCRLSVELTWRFAADQVAQSRPSRARRYAGKEQQLLKMLAGQAGSQVSARGRCALLFWIRPNWSSAI